MGILDGRVAIVTGAGGGLGRAHALRLAAEGASVVVNDLGVSIAGEPGDSSSALEVVEEIRDAGGQAVADGRDIADWQGARDLVQEAIHRFGQLDVLVNNAGILRDRTIARMSVEDWDAVIRVHLRGHFAPMHWAGEYWQNESKRGAERKASVINTTSSSGLKGVYGQGNYGAAKAGIAGLTIIASAEMRRFGVRVNAISPGARTRMTETTIPDHVKAPDDGTFDRNDPANVSSLVAYLATADAPETGHIYHVVGGYIGVMQPWHVAASIEQEHQWSVEDLRHAMGRLAVPMAEAFPGARPL